MVVKIDLRKKNCFFLTHKNVNLNYFLKKWVCVFVQVKCSFFF